MDFAGVEIIGYLITAINIVALIFLTVQDLKYRRINIVVIAIYGLLVTGLSFVGNMDVTGVLLGIVPGFVLLVLSIVTEGKIGLGDGILVLALGIGCGIRIIFGTLLVALLFSALTGIILMLLKRANRKTELPFVPFLFSGYIVCELINYTTI